MKMASLLRDDLGLPIPQYRTEDGTAFEPLTGSSGAMFIRKKDGHDVALGATTDAEAADGNGSVIALLKNLRTRLSRVETVLNTLLDPTSNGLKLAPRQPVEIVTHNELAIRDTGNYNSGLIDVRPISGRKYFRVINGCDQPMTLKLLVYSLTDLLGPIYSTTIAANTSTLVTATEIPILAEPLTQIEVQVRFDTAPTTGAVKVQLCGIPA
jgi:hypothetical protein